MTEPLSAWPVTRLATHLRDRDLWSGPAPTVQVLSGGVSGTVLRLDGPGRSLVLKQALARLDVPDLWEADPRRILTEAAALRTLHAISADHAPAVLDLDEDELLLVMPAAPVSWRTWKEQLLAGQPAEEARAVAADLGRQVRCWHEGTTAEGWPAGTPNREYFAGRADFVALRVDPFYRQVADQHSSRVGTRLHRLADGLLAADTCLVHGDLSPKNILRPPGASTPWWLVDSECAVLGDPVFDVAFLLCHLLLKSLDAERTELRTAAQDFWAGYCRPGPPAADPPPAGASPSAPSPTDVPLPEAHLVAHCAALMLARVDGVSTVDYLTPQQTALVRRQTIRALLDETDTLAGYLDLIGAHGRAA